MSNKELKRSKKPLIAKGIHTSISKTFKINHLIRKNEKDYYKQFFIKSTQNIRKIWQKINTIIHKIKNKNPTTCIKTDRGLIINIYTTGNKVNKFFRSIARKLVKLKQVQPSNNY